MSPRAFNTSGRPHGERHGGTPLNVQRTGTIGKRARTSGQALTIDLETNQTTRSMHDENIQPQNVIGL
jgi:hypothetical protein